jgi:ribonuclease P protein component
MIPLKNRIRKSSEYSKVFKTSTKFETPNFKIYLTRSIDFTSRIYRPS